MVSRSDSQQPFGVAVGDLVPIVVGQLVRSSPATASADDSSPRLISVVKVQKLGCVSSTDLAPIGFCDERIVEPLGRFGH
jgi:hypothetical protein